MQAGGRTEVLEEPRGEACGREEQVAHGEAARRLAKHSHVPRVAAKRCQSVKASRVEAKQARTQRRRR